MHSAADALPISPLRPVYDAERLILNAMQHIRIALDDRPHIVAELDAIAATVAPRLAALERSAPAFGFVHADIAPSNALVAADGSLTLIDFDLCGLGWRVMDIASYLNEIEYWRMGALEGVFLEGYTCVRPLSDADLALLPLFRVATALHILHHAAAHVNTWSSAMYLADAFMRPGIEGMKRQAALLLG
jgi:Ser/Thr protein kinase RdoA (MazF antagonist)